MNQDDTPTPMAAQLQATMDTLRSLTGAGRCTLRIDVPELDWTAEDVAIEARRADVKTLQGERSIHQRATNGVAWMTEHRRNLLQPDLRSATPPAPPQLIAVYQATAQMLTPIFDHEWTLHGWVSVHWVDGPIDITPQLERHLNAARKRAMTILGISGDPL